MGCVLVAGLELDTLTPSPQQLAMNGRCGNRARNSARKFFSAPQNRTLIVIPHHHS